MLALKRHDSTPEAIVNFYRAVAIISKPDKDGEAEARRLLEQNVVEGLATRLKA